MITLQEIYQYLDQLLSSSEFDDYCPNGLQVEGGQKVKKIGTAVSASLETIEKAVKEGVDCLVVHHGMFWKNDPFPIVGSKKKKIDLLIKNNISLIAYHLPLDAHQEYGNNWKVARDLNWRALEPFGNFQGKPIGVRGVIESSDREQLMSQMSEYYDHPCQEVFGGPQEIQTIALVSGGAHGSLLEAAQLGVDCFVTGTVDEPVWSWAHEEGINFMAFGHSATERVGPRALCEHFKEIFQIPSVFLDVYNPF
ncbi:MAG: hypothetical protein K940chlam3_01007 [Chlamydiae bacterium]|nr:hypothetical protein [Chlamydiota bacterium]